MFIVRNTYQTAKKLISSTRGRGYNKNCVFYLWTRVYEKLIFAVLCVMNDGPYTLFVTYINVHILRVSEI